MEMSGTHTVECITFGITGGLNTFKLLLIFQNVFICIFQLSSNRNLLPVASCFTFTLNETNN